MWGRATLIIVVSTIPIYAEIMTAAPTNQGLIAIRLSEGKGSVALPAKGSL